MSRRLPVGRSGPPSDFKSRAAAEALQPPPRPVPPGPASFCRSDHEDGDQAAGLLQHSVRGGAQLGPLTLAGTDPFDSDDDHARTGLLRHIGMEEKILFPAARRLVHGEIVTSVIAQLHLDHAALTALLVPTFLSANAATV